MFRKMKCINGRFAYKIKRKTLKAGHVKAEACIDNERRLDSRFCAKGFREAICANDSPPNRTVADFERASRSHII